MHYLVIVTTLDFEDEVLAIGRKAMVIHNTAPDYCMLLADITPRKQHTYAMKSVR